MTSAIFTSMERVIFHLPEGLKKKINEGDTVLVEAYMDPLAGG